LDCISQAWQNDTGIVAGGGGLELREQDFIVIQTFIMSPDHHLNASHICVANLPVPKQQEEKLYAFDRRYSQIASLLRPPFVQKNKK
jgi:hypothetical protein